MAPTLTSVGRHKQNKLLSHFLCSTQMDLFNIAKKAFLFPKAHIGRVGLSKITFVWDYFKLQIHSFDVLPRTVVGLV